MKYILKQLYALIFRNLPTMMNCLLCGLKYQHSWNIVGTPRIIKKPFLSSVLLGQRNGTIIIGRNFKCNNKTKSNSIGLIQPCVFNVATAGSTIKIGNNVGISGSTINATTTIEIGNNVLIGSGCLITDTDSHPIDWKVRIDERNENTRKAPIKICDNVFIGARSIILKGVTIGENSIIGAGSVVSKNVPANCIACGNPAKIIKTLNEQ